MSDRDVILTLIHNALLGLYYRYRDKILDHKRHAPHWATASTGAGENEETVVLDLQDLLSLCLRLEQIVGDGAIKENTSNLAIQ